MNTYHIKVDGLFLVDISSEAIGKAPTGGWYDSGYMVKGVVLSPDEEKAKAIEGNLNLNSYWKKIYDAIRYGDMKFRKIEIVRVENESSKTL